MVIYRFLLPDEYHRLVPIFAAHGGVHTMPSPAISNIVVAEDGDGNIIGMLVQQFVYHTEPLWIDEKWRGTVQWTRMLNMAMSRDSGMPRFVFAPDTHIADICKAAGFVELPWRVFTHKPEGV